MSLQRKWYSISNITWIVMILLLVGAYYWLRPNYNLFYIVAGVIMGFLLLIWFLTRRSRMKGDEELGIFLSKYHEDVIDNREEIESSTELQNENTMNN
ncbi:MAG: hypothetical protein ACFFDS_07135 [Candidatus Thorarchaeota archaeon]